MTTSDPACGSGQFIVTGASRGIGAAIAVELERRGARVVCLSRSGDAPAGRGYACDMTDEGSVRETMAKVGQAGLIAGLVNNAGVHVGGAIATLATQDYESVMRLNATAILIAAREVYPWMRSEGGTIVNIGSFFDKLGVPENLAYCASKAAVGAMTRCMAVEWARDRIRVLNVAPGYIETDLNRDFLAKPKIREWVSKRIPIASAGQPEDVARLVAQLCLEPISFLTGETIYIDGAQGVNH